MEDEGKETEVAERYGTDEVGSKRVYKLKCGGGF